MKHRPEYVARDAKHVPWPSMDRAEILKRIERAEQEYAPKRRVSYRVVLLVAVAVTVAGVVLGVVAAWLLTPGVPLWVWP